MSLLAAGDGGGSRLRAMKLLRTRQRMRLGKSRLGWKRATSESFGRFVRDQHSRVLPQIAQSRVEPMGPRAPRRAAYVIGCNVRNSQGRAASMKRESGL